MPGPIEKENQVSEQEHACPQCNRKIIQSISNRCMYCGAGLPEEYHLSAQEKAELMAQKMERFRETEENADQIISGLRKDFAIPEKWKSKMKKKADNAAAVAAALSNIHSHSNGEDGENSSR